MKRMKKAILVMMTVSLLLINVGCGRKQAVIEQAAESAAIWPDEANVNPKEIFPVVKSPTTLEIALAQNPKIQDYDTNEFTVYLEEKTGMDIKFTLLPARDTASKINLLFASSDLPEVFLGSTMLPDSMVFDYGTQGMIIPLNDLIDKYGDQINRLFAEAIDKRVKNTITYADGNIYALPKISELTSNTYGARMWVYKPWLDALNIKVPETTEEFYNMLIAFKTKDPNKNGRADEIPFVSCKSNTGGGGTSIALFLINSFVYYNGTNCLDVTNGKVEASFTKPEYKDALAYLNKLCGEGLLDPISFTQDQQQMKTLINQQTPVVGSFSGGPPKSQLLDVVSQRSKDYIQIPPLKGSRGIQYAVVTPNVPANSYVITNACKSPAAAYRLADYMYSEESTMMGRYGVEGRDWARPDSGELSSLGTPAFMKQLVDVWGMPTHNVHWQNQNPSFLPVKIMDGYTWNGDPYEYNHYSTRFTIDYFIGKEPKEYIPAKLNMSLQDTEEYNQLVSTIIAYVDENLARFITGDRNLNDWDAYLGEFPKMNLDRLLVITQEAYTRAVK
jgi:putative aldouronate transport system substrate-binding protein